MPYLDNAATSFPKPVEVHDAVDRYQRHVGTAVGRGAYRAAVEAQRVVDRCRTRAAELLGAESPQRVVFTFNGTDGLNMALHGVLRAGDHVVTSVAEHNSVLRPLRELQERLGVEVTPVGLDASGRVEPHAVREALRPNTRLIAIVHASNVTGVLQPIEDIAAVARAAGVLFLVDAAQSAGHVPLHVVDAGIDLLACPGHKGLLGPLGTGLLYVREGVESSVGSLRQGGTGTSSESDHQPESLPEKYEPGNHNTPGLFGLDAALGWLAERGVRSIFEHEQQLTRRLWDAVCEVPGVTLYGPDPDAAHLGVVSFNVDGFEPQVLASVLDDSFSIQTRAGLHCAPRIHEWLGTLAQGGTVRVSFGPFNTSDDVDLIAEALREVTG